MKGLLAWIIFGIAALTCLFWIGFGVRDDLREDDVFRNIIQKRIDLAQSSNGEVHIGVAGDWKHQGSILQGIELAAEEINADGGILNRKIVLTVEDDQGTVNGALAVAQALSSRPEIAFVLGHTRLGLNAAVAQNYEFYGLLCMTPNTVDTHSTESRFSLLFENGMPPRQISGAILNLAKEKQWTRLGLIYAKSDNAMRQARRFESMANKQEIKIPLSFAYQGRGSGIAQHMEHWKRELDMDAIVLAVDAADIIPLISACRVLEITCPFIVVGEPPATLNPAKAERLGTMYFLDSVTKTPAYADFAKRFRDRFGHAPSAEVLMGYDSLYILNQAIVKADSFVPITVAEALKDAPIANSLSGTLRFDKYGTAIKRPPVFRRY